MEVLFIKLTGEFICLQLGKTMTTAETEYE